MLKHNIVIIVVMHTQSSILLVVKPFQNLGCLQHGLPLFPVLPNVCPPTRRANRRLCMCCHHNEYILVFLVHDKSFIVYHLIVTCGRL